jgi:hypothetical protein
MPSLARRCSEWFASERAYFYPRLTGPPSYGEGADAAMSEHDPAPRRAPALSTERLATYLRDHLAGPSTASEPRLAETDHDRLIGRAQRQRADVERHREAVTPQAFAE